MKISRALDEFFFLPASPTPLAVLRIGVAGCLLVQAASLATPFLDFYTVGGTWQGSGEISPLVLASDAWVRVAASLRIGESQALLTLGSLYLVSVAAMLVGVGTRIAVALTWFFHLLLTNGQPTVYGFDAFAHASLFVLLFAPSGDALSVDRWGQPPRASPSARCCLRVFQLYLCIAYFACGIEKALGPQWWNGEAIWRAMNLPTYAQFDGHWMARVPWLAVLAGWATIGIEAGYPFFIWPKATRRYWVILTLLLHAGIGIFLGLQLFGLIMMVLTFSVWAVPAEPRTESVAVRLGARANKKGLLASREQAFL